MYCGKEGEASATLALALAELSAEPKVAVGPGTYVTYRCTVGRKRECTLRGHAMAALTAFKEAFALAGGGVTAEHVCSARAGG